MCPESTVQFSLGTKEYVFQGKKVQMYDILLARGTLVCTDRVLPQRPPLQALFVPLFLRANNFWAACEADYALPALRRVYSYESHCW